MATLTPFPGGLFSANTRGLDFLNFNVNASNFRGPPIAAVYGAPEGVVFVDDVVAFADSFDAPLVVFDDTSGATAFNYFKSACNAVGYLYKSNRIGTPVFVSQTTATTPVIYGGPFLGLGTTDSFRALSVFLAWTLLALGMSRTTQNHPYRLGMQGVSNFTADGNLSPPVFQVGGTGRSIPLDLDDLKKKWLGQAVTTTSQYQALLDAAVARPGLAALCNAALVPYLVIDDPT